MTERPLRAIITVHRVLVAALLVFTGCSSGKIQRFRALAPNQIPILFATNKHVVEVSTTPLVQRADYSVRENLRMLAPSATKWKVDLEWKIKRVLKGDAPAETMIVRNLPFPSEEVSNLGFSESAWHTNPFTNGLVLWIGFDSYEQSQFQNLTLLVPTRNPLR